MHQIFFADRILLRQVKKFQSLLSDGMDDSIIRYNEYKVDNVLSLLAY